MSVVEKRKSVKRWRYAACVMNEWLDALITHGENASPPNVRRERLLAEIRQLCVHNRIPVSVVETLERGGLPTVDDMTAFQVFMEDIERRGNEEAYSEFMSGGCDDE